MSVHRLTNQTFVLHNIEFKSRSCQTQSCHHLHLLVVQACFNNPGIHMLDHSRYLIPDIHISLIYIPFCNHTLLIRSQYSFLVLPILLLLPNQCNSFHQVAETNRCLQAEVSCCRGHGEVSYATCY